MPNVTRCGWARAEPNVSYHDTEWGVPLHDDRGLFEFLVLEGAQAGLSWATILKKRGNYRAAFDDFDARRIARYDARKATRLLADPGIVRNRAKITAAMANARAAQRLPEGLSELLWSFAPSASRPRPATLADVPATSSESVAMAKELRRRGFVFIGPTTAYALMQATGMVDDHVSDCFRASPGGG